jgi:hypothetical protein
MPTGRRSPSPPSLNPECPPLSNRQSKRSWHRWHGLCETSCDGTEQRRFAPGTRPTAARRSAARAAVVAAVCSTQRATRGPGRADGPRAEAAARRAVLRSGTRCGTPARPPGYAGTPGARR